MHVFVSGWGGFSGSHIVKFLLQSGHHVSTITRDKTASTLKKPRIPGLFELIYADINNLTSLPKNIDVVIHTAGTSPDFGTNIYDFINNNILATQKLVCLALDAHVKKFIYFSSMSIYGTIVAPTVDENTPILNPDAYGASKLFGEFCLQECADKLSSFALRLPAIVGKGARRHWLATTLEKALKDEPIKAFNLNSPFNNAIHIQDLCLFINKLLSSPLEGFNAITLASEDHLTISSIINKIKKSTNSSSQIITIPETSKSFTISIEKAKKEFQYQPSYFQTTLDAYLNEAVTICDYD